MQNVLFYYFCKQDQLEKLREEMFNTCRNLELLGKILLAQEGINGNVTGPKEQTEQFMQYLAKKYQAIEFKITPTQQHDFRKLFVRIRSEIITFKQEVDFNNVADYIEPQELKKELDLHEDIILIDGRNNYESKVGKFKGAITPDVKKFSDFPQQIKQLSHLKDKKIVTYCTGGIRCEKLATYMKQQGFNNVYQLKGGIINYGQQVGDEHWEGSCFVFDDRMTIPLTTPQEPISHCELCNTKTELYHRCCTPGCDRRFIACEECVKEHKNHCSQSCHVNHQEQAQHAKHHQLDA